MNITIVAYADEETDRDGDRTHAGGFHLLYPETDEEAAQQVADLLLDNKGRYDDWSIHLLFDGREAECDNGPADHANDHIWALARGSEAAATARFEEVKRVEREAEQRRIEERKAREAVAAEKRDRETYEKLKARFGGVVR